MFWLILIIIIVAYIIWKFNNDSKSLARRNETLGGLKKLFPEFAAHLEKNGFELVENSGVKLIYKKGLTNNLTFNRFLYIVIENKFTNIAYGYIINSNGTKINGINVEFHSDYKLEDVEMIIRKIIGNLDIRGALEKE